MDAYETLHTALKVQEGRLKCPKDIDESAMRVARVAITARKKFQGFAKRHSHSDAMFGQLGLNDVTRLLDAYAGTQPGEARDRAVKHRLAAINSSLRSLGCNTVQL